MTAEQIDRRERKRERTSSFRPTVVSRMEEIGKREREREREREGARERERTFVILPAAANCPGGDANFPAVKKSGIGLPFACLEFLYYNLRAAHLSLSRALTRARVCVCANALLCERFSRKIGGS